jgi:hypothetical protein
MRRFSAGRMSVVEDGWDGHYEEGEEQRNRRNYGPLVCQNATCSPTPKALGKADRIIWRTRMYRMKQSVYQHVTCFIDKACLKNNGQAINSIT